MGWSHSQLFITVCNIATKHCNGYIEKINVLIPLIEAFSEEDFDTIDECFDDVPYLKDACKLVWPDGLYWDDG